MLAVLSTHRVDAATLLGAEFGGRALYSIDAADGSNAQVGGPYMLAGLVALSAIRRSKRS